MLVYYSPPDMYHLGSILSTIPGFLIYSSGSSFNNLNRICAFKVLYGTGFFLIQQSSLLYIMELYAQNSASATSVYLLFRNFIGIFVPIFGSFMILKYKNRSFLTHGIINIVFVMVIFLLVRFVYKIRQPHELCCVRIRYRKSEQHDPGQF